MSVQSELDQARTLGRRIPYLRDVEGDYLTMDEIRQGADLDQWGEPDRNRHPLPA